MKKLFIFTIIFIIFIVLMSNVSAMTYNEFMNNYPNDYIYRIDFPTGHKNYISSPSELQFELEQAPESGQFLIIENPERVTYYRLRSDDGYVFTHENERFRIWAQNPDTGFEGDIDIYIWSGYAFFLPLPSQMIAKMGGMMRKIMTIAGFGILSLMALVKLLGVLKTYRVRF